MEPLHEFHAHWIEITKDNNIVWGPPVEDSYEDPQSGPKSGPSRKIQDVAKSAESLACIFLAMMPIYFFEEVAANKKILL